MIGDGSTGGRAGEQDADRLLRAARAKIARLGLELRSALREADAAERTADGSYHDIDGVHRVAREHLRSALESRLARRRSEMVVEVEMARREAARCVTDARAQAAALLAADHEAPRLGSFDESNEPPNSPTVSDLAERRDAPPDREGPLCTNGHRPSVHEPFRARANLPEPADPIVPDPAEPADPIVPDPAGPTPPEPLERAEPTLPDPMASVRPVTAEAERRTQPHVSATQASQPGASQPAPSQPGAPDPRRARLSWARLLHPNVNLALIGALLAGMSLIAWLG